MSNKTFYNIHFRPVGQGLFSHGNLEFHRADENRAPNFEWVYDCGEDKQGHHVLRQIEAYDNYNSNAIDLLMLSHFDQDHVLGIRELLKKRKPKVIVAPYLSLSERLASISTFTVNDLEYIGFLLDPGAGLREFAGPNARIVFVMPGGELPPELGDGDDTNPDRPWPSSDVRDKPQRRERKSGDYLSNSDSDPTLSGRQIFTIDGSTPFVVRSDWEFCFYNQPRPEMQTALLALLKPIWEEFEKSPKQAKEYEILIQKLRLAFETAEGPGKRPRKFDANEISLVVYSGPLRRNKKLCLSSPYPWIIPAQTPLLPYEFPFFHWHWHWPGHFEQRRCATLFTGDITLTDETFAEISGHFGSGRIDFVSYFQVPHHGAKRSFKLTEATHFQPDYSIFSSARYHANYDHPSDKVITALEEYGPTFVNEFQGLTIGGLLE